MSFGQQRLWFQHRLEPDVPHHALGRRYDIRGPLDVPALERALNTLVERHEPLRTTFHLEHGEPIQRIAASMPVQIATVTLTASNPADRRRELDRRLATELSAPYDPETGPILRVALAQTGDRQWALLLTQRFIGADRWSRAILHRELSTMYRAIVTGASTSLPPLPWRYLEFASWQRERLQGDALTRELGYWTEQLREAPDGPVLIPDRAPPAPTRAGDTVFRSLPAALVERLRARAVEHRATPFMVYLAAFYVLLYRLSGETDLVVSSPVAGRLRRETEALIGFFGNTLALRVDVSPADTVTALIGKVRRMTLEAYAHQELPFEKLVEALQLERRAFSDPLARVLFAYQNLPDAGLELDGCEVVERDAVSLSFSFELGLSLYPSPDGILVRAQYQRDRFRQSSIERWLATYECLLEGLAAAPARCIADLPLLTAAHAAAHAVVHGPAHALVPASAAVHRRFEVQVARTPTAIAVTCRDRQVTYAELNGLADAVRVALAGAGVEAGALVGILLARSIEALAAMVGILKAGAAYVPIDPHDPSLRITQILRDANVRALVTDRDVSADACRCAVVDLRLALSSTGALDPVNRSVCTAPDDLAYVMYTSGSTGAPKGVEIPHRAIVRLVDADVLPIGPGDVVLHAAPSSFDASTFEIWAPLLRGGRVVLFSEAVADVAVLDAVLHRERVTHAWLTASLFNAIIDLRPSALAGLQWLITGGEALSLPHVRRALALYPALRLFNGYGPTEATTFSTAHEITRPVPDDLPSIPIGRPIRHTSAAVLDARSRPVPVGVPGELHLCGAGLARGYLHRPALTAERFRTIDIDSEAVRAYATGDRVRLLEDGTLEFLGRIDRQVKVRGFRIELDDVEAHLNAHPSVRACAVATADDPIGGRRLVAYVVRGDAERGSSDLTAHLSARVPPYMVPSAFMVLDRLPLTSAGKLDRRALQTPPHTGPIVPPPELASLERHVARVWTDVLGQPIRHRTDNFFDFGGHSLLAMQAVARFRAELGVDVPLRAVFEAQTVAGLAHVIERLPRAGDGPNAVEGQDPAPDSPAPLAPGQARLWFLDRLAPGSAEYNSPRSYHIQGPFDAAAFERACTALVDRHEALRTTIAVDMTGEPRQHVRREWRLPFRFVDLTSAADPNEAASRHLTDDVRRPFDLEHDVLMRVTVVRLADREHLVLITCHHIAIDGWSMGVLNAELSALYGASVEDRPCPLAPLPLQYVDYARWEATRRRQSSAAAALEYWRRQLEGLVPFEIAEAADRSADRHARAARRSLMLDRPVWAAVQACARRMNVTPFMLLLAAWQIALAHVTGRADIAVAVPVANRRRPEFERLIGFFVNTLILRVDLRPGATARDVVADAKRAALEAFTHEDVPFERVVDAVNPPRRPHRMPFTAVLFALQTAPDATLALAGAEVRRRDAISDRVRFDLELTFRPIAAGGLQGSIVYRAAAVDETRVDACCRAVHRALEAILTAPDAPVVDALAGRASAVAVVPLPSPAPGAASASGAWRAAEARVVRVWQETLQLRHLEPDDDFFEVGGHSLAAARLVLALEKEFGRALPVSVLFEHGSPRRLAQLLTETAPAATWSPIVPLRESGSRPPLYLVHGIGGEVIGFRRLAELLPADQPVFAIQGRAPGVADELPVDVEGLCRHYANLLIARRPSGAVSIGGYSAGGVFALELAHQIEAAGHEVSLVAVLDGGLPPRTRTRYRWRSHTPASLLRHLWFWGLDDALRMPPREWPERLLSKARALTARAARRLGHAVPLDIRDELGIYRYPRAYSEYLEPRYRAFQRHVPRPTRADMLFVRSRTGSLHGPPGQALVEDWRPLTLGAFRTCTVPCSHRTLLHDPYVETVAAHMERALAETASGKMRVGQPDASGGP